MPARDGWIAAIDQRATQAAEVLQARQRRALQSAGPPWRYDKVSEALALQRIAEWNAPTPAIQKAAAALSDREAVAAALDAVKRVTRAEKRGQWPPETPPAVALPGQGMP